MQEISEQLAFRLSKEDISWVIAVPAIWNEAAKQFMREAAIEVSGQLHCFPNAVLQRHSHSRFDPQRRASFAQNNFTWLWNLK